MSNRSRFRLPKEHGAWAMLYVPLATGVLVAGNLSLRVFLLTLSVTFVFIARESLLVWWRARVRGKRESEAFRFLAIYAMLAGLAASPLFIVWRLYWLIPAGVAVVVLLGINALQATRREDRTIAGETLAIAGLTLTAPAAHYVATGALEVTALWLWALCAAYFASSVFYVKLRVNTINPKKEEARRQSWRRCAFYHASLLAALLLLAMGGSLSMFALAAFAPVLIRSFWYLTRPVRYINLRLVGWLEIVYSVVFLVFTTLTFRF
ncbi:MAG TPA: YwiC-like family protein [Blastocatellia bacterium]|nr:YwiC-like family protein [Blastocatellia bacterium]